MLAIASSWYAAQSFHITTENKFPCGWLDASLKAHRCRVRALQAHPKALTSPPHWTCHMIPSHPIVFLVDVDNTLLDNDGIQEDLKEHLDRVFGRAARHRYWR